MAKEVYGQAQRAQIFDRMNVSSKVWANEPKKVSILRDAAQRHRTAKCQKWPRWEDELVAKLGL